MTQPGRLVGGSSSSAATSDGSTRAPPRRILHLSRSRSAGSATGGTSVNRWACSSASRRVWADLCRVLEHVLPHRSTVDTLVDARRPAVDHLDPEEPWRRRPGFMNRRGVERLEVDPRLRCRCEGHLRHGIAPPRTRPTCCPSPAAPRVPPPRPPTLSALCVVPASAPCPPRPARAAGCRSPRAAPEGGAGPPPPSRAPGAGEIRLRHSALSERPRTAPLRSTETGPSSLTAITVARRRSTPVGVEDGGAVDLCEGVARRSKVGGRADLQRRRRQPLLDCRTGRWIGPVDEQ